MFKKSFVCVYPIGYFLYVLGTSIAYADSDPPPRTGNYSYEGIYGPSTNYN